MPEENVERELDTALARYATVEPRKGLEQRVFANLRTQQIQRDRRWSSLRGWTLGGAAVVMIAALMIWEVGAGFARRTAGPKLRPKQEMVNPETTNGSVPTRSDLNPQTAKSLNDPGPRVATFVMKCARPLQRTVRGRGGIGRTSPNAQFPTPEPLSEQEKLLVRYVDVNRREVELTSEVAALIQHDGKPKPEDSWQDQW
ncbi:MAG TPA: hypothetical protein VIY69_01995 [Candidatus Acidoferrales bacterium]